MATSNEKSNLTRFTEFAEHIGKISAILAAFGYMSLRAHLNYLGISSTTSLGVERYLMELYYVIATLLLDVIFLVAAVVVVSVVIFLVSRLLRKVPLAHRLAIGSKKWLGARRTSPIIPGVSLVLISIVYLWMLRTLSKYGLDTDVAVGLLNSDHLNNYPAESFFLLCSLACLAGYGIYNRLSPAVTRSKDRSNKIASYLWILFAVSVVVLALHLPIIYGRMVRTADYTTTQIITQDEHEHPICGLLILDSASDITLWRVENGIGQVVLLPRSRVRLITTGRVVDLLALARKATQDPAHAKVDCTGFYQP